MLYDTQPLSIPAFVDTLQKQSVEDLKKIAAQISDEKNKPVRKPDLMNFIWQRLSVDPGRLHQGLE